MKFSKTFKKLAFGAVGISLLVSCSGDQLGPDLKSASSRFVKDVTLKFMFLDKENIGVNFLLRNEAFVESTVFSEEVSWDLYIRGLSSGAETRFSGLGKQVKQSDAHWKKGFTNSLQSFQKSEKFLCELHITGLDTVFSSDTLKFYNDFNWDNIVENNVHHSVIDNFDVNQNIQGLFSTSPDNNDQDVVISVSDVTRVKGSKSLKMKGSDANSNGWLGDINHERLVEMSAATSVSELRIDSITSENDLYFNLYVHGDPTFPNSAVEVKIYENDNPQIKNRDSLMQFANEVENTLKADIQAISDAWIYDIQINWSGWKLVSIPYSSFRASNSLTKGGGGNRIKEPWRISGVAVSLLSYPTSGEAVSTFVDYLTITQGGLPQY